GGLGECQTGERGDTVCCYCRERAAERGAARIVSQGYRHGAVEGGDRVARAVLGQDRQSETTARYDATRLLGNDQLRGGQSRDANGVVAGVREPQVAVGPRRDRVERIVRKGNRVFGDGAGRRIDAAKWCREPDVSVRACRYSGGPGRGCGEKG